jgi:hypothetical protein
MRDGSCERQEEMKVMIRNVSVDELIGNLKTFGKRINQILQLDMEIWKFDSILVADFWLVKTHLFEKENIYEILFF